MTYKLKYILLLLCVIFSFQLCAQQKIISSGWQFSEDKTNWQTVNIPHTWNKNDAFDDEPGYRRGFGYYKKQIYFSSGQSEKIHYLKFNAVNQEATVFVNGQLVGNHKGGYTAFNFNITEFLKYDVYNLIEVSVDNTHNTNIPPLDADFTFYGGIYRDVELISLPKQHISLNDFASDGFYVDYPNVSNDRANVEVTVLVDNFDEKNASNQLKVSISDADNKLLLTENRKVQIGENASETLKIKFSEISNPNLWSPENPYLYRLNIELSDANGNILDEKLQKIAFRWVSVDPNKGFFLNGKPYKMIGVNRHQDYEGYGNAVPMYLQEKDIHLIKNMGANVIRFAHYPHSRQLYELCDALGILVWTEIPVINIVTNSPEYFEVSLKMQKAHLKQYYNFPSVVMFGYMNEIFLRMAFDNKSSEKEKNEAKVYTYELAKQLETLTREIAPNRLTVMALHGNELYNETKIADLPMLVGWNLYYGWYHDKIEDLGAFLDDQHKRYPNRSIMISEYGPGTDVRISTPTPMKYDFSQEYQLMLHKGYFEQVMERDFVAGMTAWNFADFGSEFRGDAIPHVNQKGLVEYNREPKDIYYWYKAVLNSKEPFVHLAVNPEMTLNLIDKNSASVTIFSNQEEGYVTLNNKPLQNITFESGIATIDVPFVNGNNELKVVVNSTETVRSINVIKFDNLKNHEFDRFGINIGSHFNVYDQNQKLTFYADRVYSKNLYGYIDGTIFNLSKEKHQGIPQNIKNTTSDPIFQTMLEDCSSYKIDVSDGDYKVTLYFVEPLLKNRVNDFYSLNSSVDSEEKKDQLRVFDININGQLVESHFDMANEYPEKYGIRKSVVLKVANNEGLTINLIPQIGKTVISGVLIEKIK